MAGKAVVDDSVVERRLRPIYEWLDLGHTRKAIQECDKVLKKQPTLHCARVLRGLALLRSGKSDEAEQSIQQVVSVCPTEDSTLQALTIYFREIHELERICLIYEEATKKDNKNEEMLSHLFMSYVRVGNYKKQQVTAMALYKLNPKNPYYFWAVISIVMQAREHGSNASSKQLCLALAERMVERFFKEGKLEAEAEVLAYLYILELQKKYVDALDILDSDLKDKITQQPANFMQLKRVHYHLALQQWQPAHNICKELIDSERDNWQHYENYCRCVVRLHAASSDSEDLTVLSEAVSFLRGVLDSSELAHATKYRAPFLALMQLVKEMSSAGLQPLVHKLAVRVEDEMLGYLSRFGSKWCAFSDVRRLFPLLPRDAATSLLQQLRDLVSLDHAGVPTDVYMLHRHLTWLQVSRCLQQSPEKSAADHLATADQLLQLYNNTQHLATQTTATDIRRNDIYLLLSSHSVLHALTMLSSSNNSANTTNSSSTNGTSSNLSSSNSSKDEAIASRLVVQLAAVLEAAVASSRANFQLKLLLLQLYNMIGSCGSSRACYESLEMKSVQLDTLGHVTALQALHSAHYQLAASIFSSTNQFFLAAAKDTCEPMIQAYRYGSLTRIPEFGEFRERLERSVHFATVTAEQMLLDLTYSTNNHKSVLSVLELASIDPVTDTTDYASLVDNTDHSVKIAWQCVYSDSSTSDTSENNSSSSTTGDATNKPLSEDDDSSSGPASPSPAVLDELRLRNITIRLVGAAYKAALSSSKAGPTKEAATNGGALKNGSSGPDCAVQQLAAVLLELETELKVQQTTTRTVPDPPDCTRLGCSRAVGGYRAGDYTHCIVQHARLLLHLHTCYTNTGAAGDTSTSWQGSHVTDCQQSLTALLAEATEQLRVLQCTASCAAISNTTALYHLHHTLQTVGIAVIIMGFSSTILRATGAAARKNKKKKTAAVAQSESVTQFQRYVSWLEQELESQQAAVTSKLDTAKLNSRNNAASVYPRITARFQDALSCASGGDTGDTKDAAEAVDALDLTKLTIDDRLTNGVQCSKSSKAAATGDQKEGETLEPVEPDFVRTCLSIDASYQESLANLSTAIGAKIKYLSSLRL